MEENYYKKGFIGWQDIEELQYGIIEGYKGSLDVLINFVVNSNDIKILDTYVFPIMFLYRHFMEVTLKFTYFNFFKNIPNTSHNLKSLFEIIENDILKRQEFKTYLLEDDYLKMKYMILDIHNRDEKGDSFRYGLDRKNNNYFTNNDSINYLEIKKNIDKIYLYFDYVNNYVYQKFIDIGE